jgi:hypothetical protein
MTDTENRPVLAVGQEVGIGEGEIALGVRWSCGHMGLILWPAGQTPSSEDVQWNLKDEASRKCARCQG